MAELVAAVARLGLGLAHGQVGQPLFGDVTEGHRHPVAGPHGAGAHPPLDAVDHPAHLDLVGGRGLQPGDHPGHHVPPGLVGEHLHHPAPGQPPDLVRSGAIGGVVRVGPGEVDDLAAAAHRVGDDEGVQGLVLEDAKPFLGRHPALDGQPQSLDDEGHGERSEDEQQGLGVLRTPQHQRIAGRRPEQPDHRGAGPGGDDAAPQASRQGRQQHGRIEGHEDRRVGDHQTQQTAHDGGHPHGAQRDDIAHDRAFHRRRETLRPTADHDAIHPPTRVPWPRNPQLGPT